MDYKLNNLKGGIMKKASKLKIYVKTEKFSFPIPALRLGFIGWAFKIARRFAFTGHKGTNEVANKILSQLSSDDIDSFIEELASHEPFELADVETEDKDGKVLVKIYTM
jgi:hypothetical protein